MPEKIIKKQAMATFKDVVRWKSKYQYEPFDTEQEAIEHENMIEACESIEKKPAAGWIYKLGFDREKDTYEDYNHDEIEWIRFKSLDEIKQFCNAKRIPLKDSDVHHNIKIMYKNLSVESILSIPCNEWVLVQYVDMLNAHHGWIKKWITTTAFKDMVQEKLNETPLVLTLNEE